MAKKHLASSPSTGGIVGAAIRKNLLKVCLEVTQSMRVKYETKKEGEEKPAKPQPTAEDKKMAEAYKKLAESRAGKQINHNYRRYILESLLIVFPEKEVALREYTNTITGDHWDEEKKTSKHPKYDPFTVVVFTSDHSAHDFKLNHPFMVYHGINNYIFSGRRDGNINTGGTTFNYYDQYDNEARLATDKEVKDFVDGLNKKELTTILSNEFFAPIVEELFKD